jgi:hypothetical protein
MKEKIINHANQPSTEIHILTKYNSPELYNKVNQSMLNYLKNGKDEVKKEKMKRLLLKRQIEF